MNILAWSGPNTLQEVNAFVTSASREKGMKWGLENSGKFNVNCVLLLRLRCFIIPSRSRKGSKSVSLASYKKCCNDFPIPPKCHLFARSAPSVHPSIDEFGALWSRVLTLTVGMHWVSNCFMRILSNVWHNCILSLSREIIAGFVFSVLWSKIGADQSEMIFFLIIRYFRLISLSTVIHST